MRGLDGRGGGGNLWRQGIRQKGASLGLDKGMLDGVFQFADVAGPFVVLQQLHGSGLESRKSAV